jgi:hypothetical protein
LLTPLFLKRRHVDAMKADMDGTEMKMGLENTLNSQMQSIPTSLFFLTDGEVSRSFPSDTNFDTDSVVIRCGDMVMMRYLLWSTVTSSKLATRREEHTSVFSLWELGTLRPLLCVKESHVGETGSA